MNTIKIITREYFEINTYIIIGYIGMSLLLFLLNFLFFQHVQDAPVDILFTMGYVVFTPGIIVLFTLFRTDINTIQDSYDYVVTLLLHTMIPIMIGTLFILLYEPLRVSNTNYLSELILLYGLSFPITFLAMILVFEHRSGYTYLLFKVLVVLIGILIYFISSYFLNHYDTRHIMQGIQIVLFYIVPLLIIGLWYRTKLIKY